MSILKRLSASLYARVDQVVSGLENHDAVVETALREGREALARGKVRLARVRRDGERLQRSLAELRREERDWGERARASADQEATALECLRRRRACRARIGELEEAVARHREGERRLADDLGEAERRLAHLGDQRNLMRTREATAEALGTLATNDRELDLEVALERWEVRITEAELELGAAPGPDPLARGFEAEEETRALRAELDQLLNREENGHER